MALFSGVGSPIWSGVLTLAEHAQSVIKKLSHQAPIRAVAITGAERRVWDTTHVIGKNLLRRLTHVRLSSRRSLTSAPTAKHLTRLSTLLWAHRRGYCRIVTTVGATNTLGSIGGARQLTLEACSLLGGACRAHVVLGHALPSCRRGRHPVRHGLWAGAAAVDSVRQGLPSLKACVRDFH